MSEDAPTIMSDFSKMTGTQWVPGYAGSLNFPQCDPCSVLLTHAVRGRKLTEDRAQAPAGYLILKPTADDL
jgi:hypothetical protein